MATDEFQNYHVNLADPAATAEAVTPSDTDDLTNTSRGIYVGVTGNIVATIGGTDITFVGAVAGSVLPIRATRIKSTGTTATDMVALS